MVPLSFMTNSLSRQKLRFYDAIGIDMYNTILAKSKKSIHKQLTENSTIGFQRSCIPRLVSQKTKNLFVCLCWIDFYISNDLFYDKNLLLLRRYSFSSTNHSSLIQVISRREHVWFQQCTAPNHACPTQPSMQPRHMCRQVCLPIPNHT